VDGVERTLPPSLEGQVERDSHRETTLIRY